MKIIKPTFVIENPGTKLEVTEMLKRIERSGRTCYKSEDRITDESSVNFIKMVLDRHHESVIEHEKITVRFIVDRGVSHEIVRHRLASYSQESTRYCNYSKSKFGREITVIDPCDAFGWSTDDLRYINWKEACEQAEYNYFRLLELGATPQEARSVLPNSLKTELVMTANLREWRWFFEKRAHHTAHPQMREVAYPLRLAFQELIPVLFDNVGDNHESQSRICQ